MKDALALFILARIWSHLLHDSSVPGHYEAMDLISSLKDQVIEEASDFQALLLAQTLHSWTSLAELPSEVAL